MVVPRRTTTEQGLGWSHQRERAAALRAFVDGTVCALCGRAMFSMQRLHLDHSVPRALGGQGPRRLVHARCNESAGARLGNRLKRARRAAVVQPGRGTTSRDW